LSFKTGSEAPDMSLGPLLLPKHRRFGSLSFYRFHENKLASF